MPDAQPLAPDEVRAVEERAFNAWPALETRLVDGWLLRFSGGYTKRANSINAWAPTRPLADVIGHAERLYLDRGLPPIVRLTPLAGDAADTLLASRGYARLDETIVMTAPLASLAAQADPNVTIFPKPPTDWLDGFAAANAVPIAARPLHDAIVTRIAGPVAFARLDGPDAPFAWGLAAIERGMVGLFDIVTASSARRRGAARRLVGHMLHWAASNTATAAYLQVLASNEPAIALYRSFGFQPAYRYHYRIATR
ncbi:MAG: GNAT family N-acetyltransferase [Hyphomicrobiaceae bacterium]